MASGLVGGEGVASYGHLQVPGSRPSGAPALPLQSAGTMLRKEFGFFSSLDLPAPQNASQEETETRAFLVTSCRSGPAGRNILWKKTELRFS